MAKQSNIISGLDINRSNICYTQYLLDEQKIANIGIQPIEKDAKDYWKAVKDGLDQLSSKFALPKDSIVAAIPGEFAIIKKVTIDASEPDVESAIFWEMSQQIMAPLEEFSYDYQQLETKKDDFVQQYLVVAYRNATLGAFTKVLHAKKIVPVVVDLDMFALITVYETNYSDRLADIGCIIYSETDKTKIVLTQNGHFIDYEIIDHTEDLAEAGAYSRQVQKIIEQLKNYNQSSFSGSHIKYYITGSFFTHADIVSALKTVLPELENLQPFRSLQCSSGMNQQQLNEFALQLALSVGLAIRGSIENT